MSATYHNITFRDYGDACLVSSNSECIDINRPVSLYLAKSLRDPEQPQDTSLRAILYVSDPYLRKCAGHVAAVKAKISSDMGHQLDTPSLLDRHVKPCLTQNHNDAYHHGFDDIYFYFNFDTLDLEAIVPQTGKDMSVNFLMTFYVEIQTSGGAFLNMVLAEWVIEHKFAQNWGSSKANKRVYGTDITINEDPYRPLSPTLSKVVSFRRYMAARLRSYAMSIRKQRLENTALLWNASRSWQERLFRSSNGQFSTQYMVGRIDEPSTLEKRPLIEERACIEHK